MYWFSEVGAAFFFYFRISSVTPVTRLPKSKDLEHRDQYYSTYSYHLHIFCENLDKNDLVDLGLNSSHHLYVMALHLLYELQFPIVKRQTYRITYSSS